MIKDGKYLEDRSVALIKLEVDVPTTEFLTGAFVRKTGRYTESIDGTKMFVDPVEFNSIAAGTKAITVRGAADFTGAVSMSAAVNISGPVVMSGAVTMTGSVTQVNSTNLAIKDNEIIINDGETGAGITHLSGFSGVRIDRGGLADYLVGFRESDDKLVAGLDNGNELKRIAFVDDIDTSDPLINGDIVPDPIDGYPKLKLDAIHGKRLNIPDNYTGVVSGSVMYYDGNNWFPYKVSDILPPPDIGEGSGCVALGESKASLGQGFAGAAEPLVYRQITFIPELPGGTDYTVVITPSENTQAKVGEFWWEKADAPTAVQRSFRVYNTGDSGVSFKWAVFAVGMPVGMARGDLEGNYNSPDLKVVGLRRVPLSENITGANPGDVLTFIDGKWAASPASGGGAITPTTPAAGDVTGPYSALKVGGIHGKSIVTKDVNGAVKPLNNPAEGDTIRFDGTNWVVAQNPLSGDVTGAHVATKVVKIQGSAVSDAPPKDGQILVWSDESGKWCPTSITKTPGTDPNGGDGDADDWWDTEEPPLIDDPWFVDVANPVSLPMFNTSKFGVPRPLHYSNPYGVAVFTPISDSSIHVRIFNDSYIPNAFSDTIISGVASVASVTFCNPSTGTCFSLGADGGVQRRNITNIETVLSTPYYNGLTQVEPTSASANQYWPGAISSARTPRYCGRYQGADIWMGVVPVALNSSNYNIVVSYDDGATFSTVRSNIPGRVISSFNFQPRALPSGGRSSGCEASDALYTYMPPYIIGVCTSSEGSPQLILGYWLHYWHMDITGNASACSSTSFAKQMDGAIKGCGCTSTYTLFSDQLDELNDNQLLDATSRGYRIYQSNSIYNTSYGSMRACGLERNNLKYPDSRTLFSVGRADNVTGLEWGSLSGRSFLSSGRLPLGYNYLMHDGGYNALGTDPMTYESVVGFGGGKLALMSPWRAENIQFVYANSFGIILEDPIANSRINLSIQGKSLENGIVSLNRKRVILLVKKADGTFAMSALRSSY